MNSRILLVEDEPGLVMTISDLLAAEGYEVHAASDGEAALAKAAGREFDLVILDIMLPRKSGLDVCRELRQRGIDSAILMLTAKNQMKQLLARFVRHGKSLSQLPRPDTPVQLNVYFACASCAGTRSLRATSA